LAGIGISPAVEKLLRQLKDRAAGLKMEVAGIKKPPSWLDILIPPSEDPRIEEYETEIANVEERIRQIEEVSSGGGLYSPGRLGFGGDGSGANSTYSMTDVR
jgi:hypothetical protein